MSATYTPVVEDIQLELDPHTRQAFDRAILTLTARATTDAEMLAVVRAELEKSRTTGRHPNATGTGFEVGNFAQMLAGGDSRGVLQRATSTSRAGSLRLGWPGLLLLGVWVVALLFFLASRRGSAATAGLPATPAPATVIATSAPLAATPAGGSVPPTVAAATATLPPPPTPTAGPTATPFPLPRLEGGGVLPHLPTRLEMGGRVWEIVPTDVVAGLKWDVVRDGRASWRAGSYLNIALSVPADTTALAEWQSLYDTQGEILVRFNTGQAYIYHVTSLFEVRASQVDVLNQQDSGVTVVMQAGGGPSSLRWVLKGDWVRPLAAGETYPPPPPPILAPPPVPTRNSP